eukprot:g5115.t1
MSEEVTALVETAPYNRSGCLHADKLVSDDGVHLRSLCPAHVLDQHFFSYLPPDPNAQFAADRAYGEIGTCANLFNQPERDAAYAVSLIKAWSDAQLFLSEAFTTHQRTDERYSMLGQPGNSWYRRTLGIQTDKVAPWYLPKTLLWEACEVTIQLVMLFDGFHAQDRSVVFMTFIVVGCNLIVLPPVILASLLLLPAPQAALVINMVELLFDKAFVILGIFIRRPTKEAVQNRVVYHGP